MRLRHYIAAMLSVWFAWTLSGLAWAVSSDDVRALIVEGQYEQAREMAIQLKTAEGYTLAAESLSSQIMLGEIGKLNKHAKEARAFAKMAIDLDPTSYDAKLQYALTDGFVTRTTGDITAWRKKLPTKTRDKIEQLQAEYPNDARVLALEAAWHLGVVRKTGDSYGQKWFGASADEGRALYKQAIDIAPHDIVIRTNYVMGLLALKSEPDVALLKDELEDILLMNPQTDVETKIKAQAQILYATLYDEKTRKQHAERFLDGK